MSIEVLRREIEQSEAVDPVGVHHEFTQGMHGRKIDLEKFMEDPSCMRLVVVETHIFIEENYNPLPKVLVSVANGTNQLVQEVARSLGCHVDFVLTEKTENGVALTLEGAEQIREEQPDFALVIEDTATTGGTSGAVAAELDAQGVRRVEVLNVVQRISKLVHLIGAGVVYKSMIDGSDWIETYEPEDCQHCRDEWELIRYGQV
jgi:orotate phosphoribosyltransferase